MKKINLFLIIIILNCFIACAQENAIKESDIVTIQVKVIQIDPVGWGVICKGVIEKVVVGDINAIRDKQNKDTITFGIDASNKYEFLKVGEVRIITFKNSHEGNKYPYLPSINGKVDKQNTIWLITEISNN